MLFNTMVFTENMHDAYSDSANLDKWLKTVDSKDLDNSAVDKKVVLKELIAIELILK